MTTGAQDFAGAPTGALAPEPGADVGIAEIEGVAASISLIGLIDASGRSGNVFFLTLFDQHPQVVSCAIVQYTYSYIVSAFGDRTVIDAKEAHQFVTQQSYFRLIYNDPAGTNAELIERMGADVRAPLDRTKIRDLCDRYFLQRATVTRRELAAVPLIIYAAARGVELRNLKYVLVGDSISLREEHVLKGFSGRIIDAMAHDFPDGRFVRLVRDPRATFASPRHQFVNSLGNMYAITPSNVLSRLRSLAAADLTPENGCVYLYWLLYLQQAGATARRQLKRYRNNFTTVRNEDLNTNFVATMDSLANWLGIVKIDAWQTDKFNPTIVGALWQGIGAYNSRYQRVTDGPLINDPSEVSSSVTGPNAYVTMRWRSRLNKREIELIERLFRGELQELGYEILFDNSSRTGLASFIRTALLPFEGELPTLAWLRRGARRGIPELWRRMFYVIAFLPFYVGSRILFADLVFRRRLFDQSPQS
jgi:hypothetical protein